MIWIIFGSLNILRCSKLKTFFLSFFLRFPSILVCSYQIQMWLWWWWFLWTTNWSSEAKRNLSYSELAVYLFAERYWINEQAVPNKNTAVTWSYLMETDNHAFNRHFNHLRGLESLWVGFDLLRTPTYADIPQIFWKINLNIDLRHVCIR